MRLGLINSVFAQAGKSSRFDLTQERQVGFDSVDIAAESKNARDRTDKPVAGLLQDLRLRGLWDRTLGPWCGEFGRWPVLQDSAGRDHNKDAFTLLMAGAGVKQGYDHGVADELGFKVAENSVSVSGGHATSLHLLGLDVDQRTVDNNGPHFLRKRR